MLATVAVRREEMDASVHFWDLCSGAWGFDSDRGLTDLPGKIILCVLQNGKWLSEGINFLGFDVVKCDHKLILSTASEYYTEARDMLIGYSNPFWSFLKFLLFLFNFILYFFFSTLADFSRIWLSRIQDVQRRERDL